MKKLNTITRFFNKDFITELIDSVKYNDNMLFEETRRLVTVFNSIVVFGILVFFFSNLNIVAIILIDLIVVNGIDFLLRLVLGFIDAKNVYENSLRNRFFNTITRLHLNLPRN